MHYFQIENYSTLHPVQYIWTIIRSEISEKRKLLREFFCCVNTNLTEQNNKKQRTSGEDFYVAVRIELR